MAWANQQHMNDGIKAAIASPNTPKHLRVHLAKRLAPANDPLSPNDIADNDNLAPEQQRGLRVAAKRITAAPGRKSINGTLPSQNALLAKIPPANPVPSFVNPFARRFAQ
jgi:hypothetical protein